MKKITFDLEQEKHFCASKREGNWIIYTCPFCPDYQRKFNIKTGAMKIRCSKQNRNLHSGSSAGSFINN